MGATRGSVILGTGGGAVTLVADIGQYKPFGDVVLGVTNFDGIAAATLQDFRFKAARQFGSLSSGAGQSAGLISLATLNALLDLLGNWGASQPFEDEMGNEGTVKALTFPHAREYGSPSAQDFLFSYTLTWKWVTLTTRYGVAYAGG